MKDFGQTLADVCKRYGKTQSDIARACEVRPQTVWKWFHNENGTPVYQIPVIADYLGCTCDELFGRVKPQDNYVSRVYSYLNDEGKQAMEQFAEMCYMNPRFLPERGERKVQA